MACSNVRWRRVLTVAVLVMSLVGSVVAGGARTAAAQDGDVAVEIADFTFSPGTVEVAVGTTVTWTNNDSAPHTVTADDGAFDSGELAQGDTFGMTFDTAGTYSYFCEIHPQMTASVVVTEAEDEAADAADEDEAADDTADAADDTDDEAADGAADDEEAEALPASGVGTTARAATDSFGVVGLALSLLIALLLAAAGIRIARRA